MQLLKLDSVAIIKNRITAKYLTATLYNSPWIKMESDKMMVYLPRHSIVKIKRFFLQKSLVFFFPPDECYKTYNFSKSTWGEHPVEDILNFTRICICVFVYLFVWRLLAKRRTLQTWKLAHILPLTLSKKRFFFPKKSPWRPLALKNCRVTWIFRISPRLPCYLRLFLDFPSKKYLNSRMLIFLQWEK